VQSKVDKQARAALQRCCPFSRLTGSCMRVPQASKEAQLDELLKANGLEAGYNALYQLPQNVAQAIRVFVDVKTAGKKRKGCVLLFICAADVLLTASHVDPSRMSLRW